MTLQLTLKFRPTTKSILAHGVRQGANGDPWALPLRPADESRAAAAPILRREQTIRELYPGGMQ
jgi:hypothetical protein